MMTSDAENGIFQKDIETDPDTGELPVLKHLDVLPSH